MPISRAESGTLIGILTNPISLYAELLGQRFDDLEPQLQRIHDNQLTKRFAGRCKITRDSSVVIVLLSTLARLPPPSSDIEVTIVIERTSKGEIWRRHFGARAMTSVLCNQHGLLHERLGAMTFRFALSAEPNRIVWTLREARLFGLIPLPLHWFEACNASEEVRDGRYRFEVRAVLKGIGTLVHYRGWLAEQPYDVT
jgi:hypothetical protein